MRKIALYAILMVFTLTLFAGCRTMTGESAGQNVDDNKITAESKAIILKDPDAHYTKISVTTTQGDVVLSGFVNSRDTEDRIVSKIRQVNGVRSVTSHLKVEEPPR
jgi:osmotically-inducible protein OsmY